MGLVSAGSMGTTEFSRSVQDEVKCSYLQVFGAVECYIQYLIWV